MLARVRPWRAWVAMNLWCFCRGSVPSGALGVGEKIRHQLSQPFTVGGHVVSIACSIGVAIFPEHGSDEKVLRRCADEAMYVSKGAGRNCVTLYGGVPAGVSVFATGDEPSVLRLVWHRSFQCGEPSIDHEHRQLFDQTNRLIRAMLQSELRAIRCSSYWIN